MSAPLSHKVQTVLPRIDSAQHRHSTVDILAGHHESVVQAVPIHRRPQLHGLELQQNLLSGRKQIHYQSAIQFVLHGHGESGAFEVADRLRRPLAARQLNCVWGTGLILTTKVIHSKRPKAVVKALKNRVLTKATDAQSIGTLAGAQAPQFGALVRMVARAIQLAERFLGRLTGTAGDVHVGEQIQEATVFLPLGLVLAIRHEMSTTVTVHIVGRGKRGALP